MGSEQNNQDDGAVPLLGSWGAWYALVLLVLAALIAGFTLIGREYR